MFIHNHNWTRAFLGTAIGVTAMLVAPSASAERIRWRAGPANTASRSPQEIREAITALASRGEAHHLVVQFDGPAGSRERAALESEGLRLLKYLGNNAYFAAWSRAPVDATALMRTSPIVDVRPVQRAWKLHPTFAAGRAPAWAIVSGKSEHGPAGPDVTAAYVLFHPDVALVPEGVSIARRHGAVVRAHVRSVNGLVVELPLGQIPALADEDAVQWIEPPLPPLEGVNDGVRVSTQADIVQAPPYGLDGTGVNVLVYDGGNAADYHPDFGGRLAARDSDPNSNTDHSTHVACTIGGDGAASEGLYRGMAPNVTLQSYRFQYDGSDVFLYTNPGDIESDYDEAINVYGVHIANNSIGTNACKNGFDCEITGDYGVTAQLIDAIVHGSLGAPFRVVWSAGNERSCDRCGGEGVHTPEGYHSTAPPACAKNHITVGAIHSDTNDVTNFTSWGPADDGRLKPDLVAPGCQEGLDEGVTSCVLVDYYAAYCGTSMSAPAVTGLAALLLQDFRVQFPGWPDPLNSTVKALLAHNALDLENPGPDYKTGYGAVRIQNTIDSMRVGSFLEAEVDQGQEFMTFTYRRSGPVRITLAWDDVPGTPNVEPALVNDLDLQVFDPDFNRYYPWTLDPDDPAEEAVQNRPDRINNIEQVYAAAGLGGTGVWTIRVVGFDVPAGPQSFSLCIDPPMLEDCNENGISDADEIQADPSLDCSGNGALDECEPDCDGDGTADSCAIFSGAASDCNSNLLPDCCEPWSDCDGDGLFDPCDITAGGLPDCNDNWIPDTCISLEIDCNANLIPDLCDLEAGTSEDCDADGVPDECQDTSTDCNENGIWDACDLSSGSSEDFNANGVLDECEPNRTIYVDVAACPGSGSGTECDPYCKIQDAIDASISGDIVAVADGTYKGNGQTSLRFRGRSITVRSATGPDACIIDGEWLYDHRGFIFSEGETPDAVVDGFTILETYSSGGSGVFIDGASPTIRNCRFERCVALGWGTEGGAAVVRNGSAPTFVDCIFTESYSGAIWNYSGSHLTLLNCLFHDQQDGLWNDGTITAVNCDFRVNCTAVRVFNEGHFTLINGTFSENAHALWLAQDSSATLIGCIFVANGGAIINWGTALTLSGCTIAYVPRHVVVPWCFIPFETDEPFNDLSLGGTNFVDNSIVQVRLRPSDGSTLIVSYSNFHGLYPCDDCIIELNEGVIDVDPHLVYDVQGDPRLAPDSLCVNAGDPNFYPLFRQTDVDGDPRVLYRTVDIGADEALEILDCNNNQLADWQDIAEGYSEDVNQNGAADECEDRWTAYVDDDGPSDPGPGDPTVSDPFEDGTRYHPFDTIQEAIDAAWDVVIVLDGVYTGEGNRDLNLGGRRLWVRSEKGPDHCLIDSGGENRAFDLRSGESADTRIDGFTIMNGRPQYVGGGAILAVNSSPTIENCIFAANRASFGGAILLENSAATIRRCYFVGNHDNEGGGGVYIRPDSDPLITNCVFAGNTSSAIHCKQCTATIENCTVVGNRSGDNGGGISCVYLGASPLIRHCTIARNYVAPNVEGGGGGLFAGSHADPSVVNSIIWGNIATANGSIYVDNASAYLEYNDVEGGDPGGDVVWGPGNIDQDPFFPTRPPGTWTADGVYDPQTRLVSVTDSTAAWQAGELVGLFINPDTSRYFQSLIVDNTATKIWMWPDWSTVDDNLSWVAAGAGYEIYDYHLAFDSPAVEAGDPGYAPYDGEIDADRESRMNGGRVDMGSDELHDCNANTVLDYQDVILQDSEDCNANGIPDECETWVDCNGNGVFDACDIRAVPSRDCNENAVPDSCDLAEGTSADCNLDTVPDECDIAYGYEFDCNLNMIPDSCDLAEGTSADINGNDVPDECDIDCQPNGIPDEWDIAGGTSEDCNANDRPDECEWIDCNHNAVLDACDISDHVSSDCNENGVPDECELSEHDCNENNVPDNCDIGLGASPDCQPNGIPDECELDGQDCNENGVPDDCEIASGSSADCQPNGVPDECDADCNGNGIPDDCEPTPDIDGDGVDDCTDLCPCTPPGEFCICPAYGECCWFEGAMCVPDYSYDLCLEQGGTPDCAPVPCEDGCLLVFTDCNGNGVPDVRDVSCYAYCDPPCGESADCNFNGIPDECDVAAGTATDGDFDDVPDECDNCELNNPDQADCQANEIGDVCDIAEGTSADANGNGIPDECELDPARPAPYPHNRARNRYLSFDPNPDNDGRALGFKVTLRSLNLGSCDAAGSAEVEGWSCRTDDDCRACSVEGNPCWTALLHCSAGETCDPTGAHCVDDQANSVGTTWWVGPEHPAPGRDVHLLVSESYRKVTPSWPEVVHLADCEVVPLAVYGIRAVLATPEPEDPESESAELEVRTIARPDCWWADCVGELGMYCTGTWAPCTGDGDCPSGRSCLEQWPPPDGFINFHDITAAVFRFSMAPGSAITDVANLDLHGNDGGDAGVDPPNYAVNFADIANMISAFQGWPYPYSNPGDCPDIGTWP